MISNEISELTNILEKFQSGEVKTKKENEFTKKFVIVNNDNKRSFTNQKDRTRRDSKNINAIYKMREKYLKDIKYQRIIDSKIY